MDFNVNSPIIFAGVIIIILAVLGQSIFFLVRALKRAKEKGMDKGVIKRTIVSSAIFTVAPALAIVIGVITLSKSLGLAVPWLRLSIIGALSYEMVAANNALSAVGETLGQTITDPQIFVTILWVMTLGIITGLVLPQFFSKKLQKGLISLEKKDKKWYAILQDAMFLGMVSAFLGFIFCNVDRLWKAVDGIFTDAKSGKQYTATSGLVPVCVMVSTAILMAALGILSKKTKARWITDFALPICLIVGMGLAIPFTMLLGGEI